MNKYYLDNRVNATLYVLTHYTLATKTRVGSNFFTFKADISVKPVVSGFGYAPTLFVFIQYGVVGTTKVPFV